MPRTSFTVHSRAAVAGNPSDGFGGAVCSIVVPFFSATASIDPSGSDAPVELIAASKARFAESVCAVDVGVSIETTIPRSVGLAGSSAIVIAVLSALDRHVGSALSRMEIAVLAHQVERSDLGIAGGWQDQLIQSHGHSGLMEFAGTPSLTALEIGGPSIPVYLAWAESASQDSGSSHGDLRKHRDANDPVWDDLATEARSAASAITKRNVHQLKGAIDRTFDIRRTVMDIAPAQQQMVDTARSLGASANFAGSGGAILGVLPKDSTPFLAGMRDAGYDIETWSLQ